jgi:SAM-dependent methyltransferase
VTYRRPTCRLCDSALKIVLELAPTPLANSYPDQPYQGEKHPLNLMECLECRHVQGEWVVDAETLYGDYKYVTPQAMDAHWKPYASKLKRRYPSAKKVLEIGCNYGGMLEHLRNRFPGAIGIDPAFESEFIINGYFSHEKARELRQSHGKFDLIVANNVFAHIDDLQGVFKGVEWLLDRQGVLVFEVQYLPELVRSCAFDTIYHEHHDYHTIGALQRFTRRYGLEIKRVERVAVHGGSIRVHARRAPQSRKVFQERIDWQAFRASINAMKERTLKALDGKRVKMFGAPAKATTLVHHFGLERFIAYAVDSTPQKWGCYIPGTNIKILPEATIEQSKSTAEMLLAAWNYRDYVQKKYPDIRFIVPGEEPLKMAA